MEEKCENLAACGFFKNCRANTEVIKHGWISMFCESKEKSERCVRKKIKRETGSPPADNMSPTGDMVMLINKI